jgi:signal transduction histidine kinase
MTGPTVVAVRLTRRLSPRTVEVLVLAAIALPTVMDAWWNEAGTRQADTATWALTAASLVVLAGRRRWPLAVAAVTGVSLTGLFLLGHRGELLHLPAMVALYTVAVAGNRRRTIITGIVAAVWSGALGAASDDPAGAPGGSPMYELLVPLVPLALGEAVRAGRELVAHTEAERQREAERRIADERARLARDLHDVIAHTVVAVNVLVAAASAAFDRDPDAARTALDEARDAGRSALYELRTSVALLRAGHGTAPTARLDDLPALVETARATGLVVTVDDLRGRDPLPAPVELTAYRVIQEALTNVMRHSEAGTVTIALDPVDDGLVVEVVDDGTGPHGMTGGSPGHGLTGMAERVRAIGGTLDHGPHTGHDRGFRVRAVLPTADHDRSTVTT